VYNMYLVYVIQRGPEKKWTVFEPLMVNNLGIVLVKRRTICQSFDI